jgi:hypothetical protein
MLFLIIAYTFSSAKLEIRAEQVLPGSVGGEEEGGGLGGRNDPKMYAHVNKCI